MTVSVTSTKTKIRVVAPYNVDFPAQAKKIGGKWDPEAKSWDFDIRNEEYVRQLLKKYYGTDGHIPADTVSVRVALLDDSDALCGPLTLAGRVIAYASGRDSGTRLGNGVIIESGGFYSGGSMKNWRTIAKDGTKIIIHDFPRNFIDQVKTDVKSIEIVEHKKIDIDKFKREREILIKKIAEIDAIIKNHVDS